MRTLVPSATRGAWISWPACEITLSLDAPYLRRMYACCGQARPQDEALHILITLIQLTKMNAVRRNDDVGCFTSLI